jgi:hypothetical protein
MPRVPDVELESVGLRDRLSSCLRPKIAVWLGLAAGICAPYFALQRVEWFPLRAPPVMQIDRAVAFEPGYVWAYLSIALLVPLAPALAASRDALRRYALGLFLLCAPCFAAFALFPVEGPRPPQLPDHGMYRLIVSLDRPTNSMPSLHAGLVVYSLLFGLRVLREALPARRHAAAALIGCAWAVLILYSTLATKQHWALDLPPGAALAAGAHALAWRGSVGVALQRTAPIRSG